MSSAEMEKRSRKTETERGGGGETREVGPRKIRERKTTRGEKEREKKRNVQFLSIYS